MKVRKFVFIFLAAALLAGCSGGGLSNAEAKEVIYGVYFQDASIIQKQKCELTPQMKDEGVSEVWLVRYRFTKSGTEGGMLLTPGDTEEYPWVPYQAMIEKCP